ncbi:MAG: NADP-dependent oxidoreductase [Alphaproteobacteria bacterium]
MKAIQFHQYGGPEVVTLADIPAPEPAPSEVLVAIAAASVNPIDWKMRAGLVREYFDVALPHVLGRDFSGVVRAVGGKVEGIAVGDEVFGVGDAMGQGTHAEAIAVDAELVARKPEALAHDAAAALGATGMTLIAAFEDASSIAPGQKVLIHGGAGGLGHLAVQYARHRGAEVIATAGPANHDFVRAMGAAQVIDYTACDFAGAVSGCDVVLDTIGGEVHKRSLAVVKPGGVLVYVTAAPIPPYAVREDISVLRAPVRGGRAVFERLAELVGQGVLSPVIEHRFALAEAPAAYALSETGHVRGKIVLVP